jgi:hypothetical protein
MKRFGSLAVGFALGFVVGSAAIASAAFGRAGWQRFGLPFKEGYVAGFVDCVRIAKALDPFSYIATNFPAPPRAKAIVWVRTIDELYAKDEHKDRTLAQILIIAGAKLEENFGDDQLRPNDKRLDALRNAIDRQRRALLQAKKTVEAAQGELNKGGTSDTAKAQNPAAENSAPKVGDAPDAQLRAEQAPPTPEGLRRGIAPEGAPRGEGNAENVGPSQEKQE